MKKTCSTCKKSGFQKETCNSGKWLICKHSDRSTVAGAAIRVYPHEPGELSYWVGRPQKQRRVAKRATNKPIAEMGYVREAFKIAMANSIDNNYREMWRTRKNAVLWALRH